MTQKQEVIDPSGHSQKRVAPGDQQHQEGEIERLQHPDGEGVRLHVVDRDEGLVMLPNKPLTEFEADGQTQSQAGFHCGGHSRELVGFHVAPLQSLPDHLLDVLSMKLLCHCGDDTATPAAGDKIVTEGDTSAKESNVIDLLILSAKNSIIFSGEMTRMSEI